MLGLKSETHGDDTPEILNQTTGLIFETTSWIPGSKSTVSSAIPYHTPASKKTEEYDGLLKTTLTAVGGGAYKYWDTHLAKVTWLVNTRASANRAGPTQSELLFTVAGSKVLVVHIKLCWGIQSGLFLLQVKANPFVGLLLHCLKLKFYKPKLIISRKLKYVILTESLACNIT